MSSSEAFLLHARDPRLAPLAFVPVPAWLWTADGRELLWANAAGAAFLGESGPAGLIGRRTGEPLAREIARLGGALPRSEAGQLARLRGLAPMGKLLTCTCSRLRLTDRSAILVTPVERVASPLSFAERVASALPEADAIAFTPAGELLWAGSAAREVLRGCSSLDELGVSAAFQRALAQGRAEVATAAGQLLLEPIGQGDASALVGRLAPAVVAEPAPPAAPPEPMPLTRADALAQADVLTRADPLTRADLETPTSLAPEPSPHAPPLPEAPAAAVPPTQPTATVEAAPPETPDLSGPAAPELPAAAESAAPEMPVPAMTPAPALTEAFALLEAAEARLVQRRHPLRFVWTTDADGGFAIEPGDFTALAAATEVAGRPQPWHELAQRLGLDPEGRVQRAIASHDTFSGVTVGWPVDAATVRLPVVLSGLPVVDRERCFRGYRGFGVCRDVDAIAAAITARRAVAALPGASPGRASPPSASTLPPAAPALPPEEAAAPEPHPRFTLVPAVPNVLPFRGGTPERRALNSLERSAFQEIARALGARLEGEALLPPVDPIGELSAAADAPEALDNAEPQAPAESPAAVAAEPLPSGTTSADAASADAVLRAALERLPVGVLLYRSAAVIFANRALLEWTGHATAAALAQAGGIEGLFAEAETSTGTDGASRPLALRMADGGILAVEARLATLAAEGGKVMMLTLLPLQQPAQAAPAAPEQSAGEAAPTPKSQPASPPVAETSASPAAIAAPEPATPEPVTPEPALLEPAASPDATELTAARATAAELRSILDTATDGVIVVDPQGRVLSFNRSAEALFGYEAPQIEGKSFEELFAPESQRDAGDYLDGLTRSGVASLLNDGREVIGRVRQGGLVPLFMTMGRIAETPPKFCAVLRDITQWKRAEEELTTAKQQAEKSSSAKSDFLAKISHEIRTPLNAIIGFSEVMLEQRFGPIGNERYREYLKDIRTSGEHMISLLNDLLDLSKIEAGKLDLTFVPVNLNDAMQQCVAIMQPQANRDRIIIRSALAASLPPVVADARSIRQIILNLLSNSIKFTGPGGQVIVSTALTDAGEAVLRVRDTGVGMSEKDIETALQPFRQLPATSTRINVAGSGLGLPLTKALAEANRAAFVIKSAANAGTLVEIVFPPNRVLAE